MESLRELYKIGPGPSSSHTIGPKNAALKFKKMYSAATKYKVELFGSLALTGRGHLTDVILLETMKPISTEIVFNNKFISENANTMDFYAYKDDKEIGYMRAYSVGGGSIVIEGEDKSEVIDVFPYNSMNDIKEKLLMSNISLVDLVCMYDLGIKDYLHDVFIKMINCVDRGLAAEGLIPGRLKLERVAKSIFNDAQQLVDKEKGISEKNKLLLSAYAYAGAEENASGGTVVTAPTCGSCGVVPAILYFYYKNRKVSEEKLIDSLIVGGVFGNIVKKNATVSGAAGGCQAEIGTACAMAAAMTAYLMDCDIFQIEYAAEVAMEHHLGLTCDPIMGYVQIPCIERNGVAALRAYDAAIYGRHISKFRHNRVSFDDVVSVMKETGNSLKKDYKETSRGGLARKFKHVFKKKSKK